MDCIEKMQYPIIRKLHYTRIFGFILSSLCIRILLFRTFSIRLSLYRTFVPNPDIAFGTMPQRWRVIWFNLFRQFFRSFVLIDFYVVIQSVFTGMLHVNTQSGVNQFCSIPTWLSN